MLVESECIVILLVVMVFLFLRKGQKDYAALTAPLIILPFVNGLMNIVVAFLKIPINNNILCIVDIVAMAASVSIMGVMSIKLKTKKTRTVYMCVSVGFTVALTLIYLYNYVF